MSARRLVPVLAVAVFAHASAAMAAAGEVIPGTLSLDTALQIARRHQPQLRQAHANTLAAEARVDQARAPLLPQVGASASYARQTSNFTPTPTTTTGGTNGFTAGRSTFDSINYFRSGVNASQLL
jgi:outer membrane protein